MSQVFPALRAFAASCLLLAGGALFAATTPPAADDEAIAALQDAYVLSVMQGKQADIHRELIAAVMRRIKRSYATDVDMAALAAVAAKVVALLPPGVGDPAEVFKKSIQEALRTLDPHSRYFDARSAGNALADINGSFGGLGLELQATEGALRVVTPVPGGPAARAGLEAGDLIVRVDNHPVAGEALPDAIARMRGEPGTSVSITVQRNAPAQEFTVSLVRETIRRPVLRSGIEGGVLVLRLAMFTASASSLLEQAIGRVAERKPQAVVLDLRGNPGGLLREAVKVADAFLAAGEIVTVRGSTPGRQRTWHADASELLAGVPMVVLIDARSASASELVADALQHNGRATVLGQRSFGKGSVQSTFPMGENRGALKLTTAIYHGPSGQTLHKIGVSPDIELLGTANTRPVPAAPEGAAATAQGAAAAKDAAPKRIALARVDAGRCAPLRERDPALACAVAYLQAGSVDAFVAKLSREP